MPTNEIKIKILKEKLETLSGMKVILTEKIINSDKNKIKLKEERRIRPGSNQDHSPRNSARVEALIKIDNQILALSEKVENIQEKYSDLVNPQKVELLNRAFKNLRKLLMSL